LQPENPELSRRKNGSSFKAIVTVLAPASGLCTSDYQLFPEEVRQGSPGGERLKGINLILGKMPKVKTNSSAKKRFKVTATGKITHQKSFKRHILTKKSKKRKRNMRKDGEVAKSHVDFVKRLLRLK